MANKIFWMGECELTHAALLVHEYIRKMNPTINGEEKLIPDPGGIDSEAISMTGILM